MAEEQEVHMKKYSKKKKWIAANKMRTKADVDNHTYVVVLNTYAATQLIDALRYSGWAKFGLLKYVIKHKKRNKINKKCEKMKNKYGQNVNGIIK